MSAGPVDAFEAVDVEDRSAGEVAEESYRDYALYVAQDRAIPHLVDGLKPVQRRILYAMHGLSLGHDAKPKKSARTIGDVIGKYHPHGDSACYEAMVLMAQGFATRYPLVHGQGNWGSAEDPRSFAAQRYTEARMTAYADVLLRDLGAGGVGWRENFDATMREPVWLPARLPHVLLNGASGIAVGLTTDIPPHNLGEVAEACRVVLDDAEADDEAVLAPIRGPDFASGALVASSASEIRQALRTGRGTLRVRARWAEEKGDVVVTALPPQVAGARVAQRIGEMMEAGDLPGCRGMRDEADERTPTRLVLEVARGVAPEALAEQVMAATELERTVRVEVTVLETDGRPVCMGVAALVRRWVAERMAQVRSALEARREAIAERLEVIAGLEVATARCEEVVRTIRTAEQPKEALVRDFLLTERQAAAVVAMRLGTLGRLEVEKLAKERKALEREAKGIDRSLASRKGLAAVVAEDVAAAVAEHGDERRSPIAERAAAKAQAGAAEVRDPVTVVLSVQGLVRAAKGHDVAPSKLGYRDGDGPKSAVRTDTAATLVVLDSNGRAYGLPVRGLPSARGLGEPLAARFDAKGGATFEALVAGADEAQMLLAGSGGYGMRTTLGQQRTARRAGKQALVLGEGEAPVRPVGWPEDAAEVVVVGTDGYALAFPAGEVPKLGKGKGVKLLKVGGKAGSRLAAACALREGQGLEVVGSEGKVVLGRRSINALAARRGGRGKRLETVAKVGEVRRARAVALGQ